MYQKATGAGSVLAGSIVLPNTGGNRLLAVAAIVSIAVGSAIIVSTIARAVAVRASKA